MSGTDTAVMKSQADSKMQKGTGLVNKPSQEGFVIVNGCKNSRIVCTFDRVFRSAVLVPLIALSVLLAHSALAVPVKSMNRHEQKRPEVAYSLPTTSPPESGAGTRRAGGGAHR